MASALGAKALTRILLPTSVAAAGYGATRPATKEWVKNFVTGPGKYSRIALLFLLLLNWKSLPGAWTIRIWRAMIYHLFVRPRPRLPPSCLFHYSITTSYASLVETDYNLHKSNSTYFADLDVSRTHLVSHLLRPGLKAIAENLSTGCVLDPRTNKPVNGKMGVMLGSVFASFRKEIKPMEKFEMWSRILSWDRKWFYIATHFVQPTRPASWDWQGRRWGPTRKPILAEKGEQGWEKRIFATCVSKYVFKLGRLTVNPAVVVEQSGFLPEGRPGGWTGGESGTGTPVELNGETVFPAAPGENGEQGGEEWRWQHVEKMRLKGMEFAEHFAALDALHNDWDAGEEGALGHFWIG
ncbi:hypothetical protein MKZ38_001316 [Zalerion maritima]|uniref:Capsule polysaccharide biosynthesis protein n=1 Tax=Zalerion maritima TaxID=339359 RepID=A0AAD5RFD7_9PEZI|nr:hypothetical protein MKZ38_001316 [Zalerion maritima]